jgi:hypothetical protein
MKFRNKKTGEEIEIYQNSIFQSLCDVVKTLGYKQIKLEEVKPEPESEITILELKSNNIGMIFTLNDDGTYGDSRLHLDIIKRDSEDKTWTGMTIHKVLRNSDKVQFKVGGWFKYKDCYFQIKSFKEYGKFVTSRYPIYFDGHISSITPATFAYNSEDGKPMFVGQEHWYVDRENFLLYQADTKNKEDEGKEFFANFHTKEDAEKWIAEQNTLNQTFTLSELKNFDGTREEFINQKTYNQ